MKYLIILILIALAGCAMRQQIADMIDPWGKVQRDSQGVKP